MIRAALYLVAAGAVWFAEGYVFSRFLDFSVWQTVTLALVYAGLFATAVVLLVRWSRSVGGPVEGLARWRLLSLAPMFVGVVGSFMSLPILLLVAAAGHLG